MSDTEINYATIVNKFNSEKVENKIDGLINKIDKMEKLIKSIIKVQNTTLQILRQMNKDLFENDIEFSNKYYPEPLGIKSSSLERTNQSNYLNYACTRMYDITGDISWICGFYMILKNNKQDIDLLFKRLEKLDIDICDKQYNDIRKAFENYFEMSFVSIDLEY